jgi:hypothetical protein
LAISSEGELSLSGKFRISSSRVISFFGLAEVVNLETLLIVSLVSGSITSVIKVPLNTVLVYSFSLLLFFLVHIGGVTRVLHLFVQTVVVLLSGRVVT